MNLPLKGDRVVITELQRDQLPLALEIFNSNPQFNQWRHGEPQYSLADWEKDYEESLTLPSSRWLTIRREETLVGICHLLLDNPHDRKSWIGLLLIEEEQQGKGLGKEAALLVERYVREQGKKSLHVGVIVHNLPALLFWGKLGYEQYRQVVAPVGRLTQEVLLLAKILDG